MQACMVSIAHEPHTYVGFLTLLVWCWVQELIGPVDEVSRGGE